jgi:hypothetical protein
MLSPEELCMQIFGFMALRRFSPIKNGSVFVQMSSAPAGRERSRKVSETVTITMPLSEAADFIKLIHSKGYTIRRKERRA